jgi:hypothetical protein
MAVAVDYDLHGLVSVRLLDAGPREVATVDRQLGPIHAAGRVDEPDIRIRFVDRLPFESPVQLLGEGDAGFTEDAFLILRGKHKSRVRVHLPFEHIGGPIQITCERGLPAVPLLIPILNLTALAKGALPLHASAFRYNGRGVLVTGWAKGGKTEVLLGFAAAGAEYVGDEWIYLVDHGAHALGIPEPIRVWDWHLSELPRFQQRLPRSERLRLKTLQLAADSLGRLVQGHGATAGGWRRGVRAGARLLANQRYVHMPPQQVFQGQVGGMRMDVDRVILASTHDVADIDVRSVLPETVAARMAFSLEEERKDLISYYGRFRFAFPHKRNRLLECATRLERSRLFGFLRGRRCYAVAHPNPVSIPALYRAVRPVVLD